jgi:uncharacterized protein YuzE
MQEMYMKIRYFADTDTVYIELTQNPVVESRDLNEYTVIDLDENENLVAITVEQASERATIAASPPAQARCNSSADSAESTASAILLPTP